MYYVYVLENQQGWHYIGSCLDVAARLIRHNQNSVKSTKHRGPFKIAYQEEVASRKDARQRENALKGHKGNIVLQRLINRSVPIV